MRTFLAMLTAAVLGSWQSASAEVPEKVVDIPTRPGVTQRFLLLTPEKPRASVILFAGGDGGLDITQKGSIRFLGENFLVRTRQLFAERGLTVAVVDAPSDRQDAALKGFRQTREHGADIKTVIAWLKQQNNAPVWLVGTSNGTLSAAFAATELRAGEGGPDGLVLTSTIVNNAGEQVRTVPEMPLDRVAVPVLVVHHEQDGCKYCPYGEVPALLKQLTGSPRKELLSFRGGQDKGKPCHAMAYHGFKGLDQEVVGKISDWIVSK